MPPLIKIFCLSTGMFVIPKIFSLNWEPEVLESTSISYTLPEFLIETVLVNMLLQNESVYLLMVIVVASQSAGEII